MTDRRRNLFILLLVLGLIAASRRGHRDEGDEARPRPAGRRLARLPGQADAAAADGHAGVAGPRARHHARARRRARRRRAGDPALGRRPDRGRASPASRTPSAPPSRSARPPSCTSTTGSRTSSAETASRTRRELNGGTSADHRALQGGQARRPSATGGSTPTTRRKLTHRGTTRSTRSPSRSTTGPAADSKEAALADLDAGAGADAPRSSRCRRASSSSAPRSRRPPRPRTPTAGGRAATTRRSSAPTSRTRSRTSTGRRGNEPIVTFELHGQGPQAFQTITREIAQRGADNALAGRARSTRVAALRDRARQRARLGAVHQLPREPGRHRRLDGRPDLRRLHDPLAPRTWRRSSRSARCRSSSS